MIILLQIQNEFGFFVMNLNNYFLNITEAIYLLAKQL